MIINQSIVKGRFKKLWGIITNNKLKKIDGELNSINGQLEEKYGEAEETSKLQFNKIFKKHEKKNDSKEKEI